MEKNTTTKMIFLFVLVSLIITVSAVIYFYRQKLPPNQSALSFLEEGVIEETSNPSESQSPNWWLNSGGISEMKKDWAKTNLGSLPENSRWRKLYAKNNSRDTDNGFHPQNIFRLVTQKKWHNFVQETYFNIDQLNLSESKYREESNGVLLFNRYADGDNLYYAGLRVDGHAVIKKKIKGKYYTLTEKDILAKGKEYDRDSQPNFLPLHQWIGIKSEVTNIENDAVNIKLFVDLNRTGNWNLVLEKEDQGDSFGHSPLLKEGRAGIRTDFMDVEFSDYKIEEISN